jgi:hypothetical protein
MIRNLQETIPKIGLIRISQIDVISMSLNLGRSLSLGKDQGERSARIHQKMVRSSSSLMTTVGDQENVMRNLKMRSKILIKIQNTWSLPTKIQVVVKSTTQIDQLR